MSTHRTNSVVHVTAAMAALIGVLVSGCGMRTPTPPPEESPNVAALESAAEYRIGVNDQVEVNVWRDPELSVSMPVRPDGNITVPLIGDVRAGGRTPGQVADDVAERLSQYVRNPQVTVIVSELRSHEYLSRVRVTGAVNTPRSIPYQPGMTALDAVLEAGGVNEFAAPSRAMLYRRAGGGDDDRQAYQLNLDHILERGDLATNMQLRPGDVISVPERRF